MHAQPASTPACSSALDQLCNLLKHDTTGAPAAAAALLLSPSPLPPSDSHQSFLPRCVLLLYLSVFALDLDIAKAGLFSPSRNEHPAETHSPPLVGSVSFVVGCRGCHFSEIDCHFGRPSRRYGPTLVDPSSHSRAATLLPVVDCLVRSTAHTPNSITKADVSITSLRRRDRLSGITSDQRLPRSSLRPNRGESTPCGSRLD